MESSLAVNNPQRITSNKYRTSPNEPVRVCFYGRVSTQHEAQMNALDNQIEWYDSILADHPNWQKVSVYVDKGVTGTQAKKRRGFMRMIEDASHGHPIIMIIAAFLVRKRHLQSRREGTF